MMRLVVGQAKAAANPKAMFTAPTTTSSTHEDTEDGVRERSSREG